ncbi:MAG: hypothetical protein CVU57_26930 [Deltaproteobacteria bacterium HGW-Deltaproteobacteria-15]|nr:MAG: hypothetical protein CVU57_26930 [Deltaproteobacteria bacterium HGW-Deltaproteobacteria-15]
MSFSSTATDGEPSFKTRRFRISVAGTCDIPLHEMFEMERGLATEKDESQFFTSPSLPHYEIAKQALAKGPLAMYFVHEW